MHRASPPVAPPDPQLIDALQDPAAFPEPVAATELIETHISWVILAGDYVYKIKKPLTLDFLDFGTLELRKFYCDEEIRLNKPWAEEIYVDVVPITRDEGRPRFGGAGEAVEYAVRMRRFDQDLRLDRQLELDLLSIDDMRELGRAVAARHAGAPTPSPARREHFLAMTEQLMWDNFTTLEGSIDAETLAPLSAWTRHQLEACRELIGRRFDDGFVRDCHGDLHLANLVRLPGGITTFDCIEFNVDLRTIDVVCDIAFLVMDLVARDRHDLAAHFLNRYLERTGDYSGVALLDLYFVYRCLVRAKVAVIRSQEQETQSAREVDLAEAGRYTNMARRQSEKRAPVLVVMTGLSGSGKTRVASELMAALPAIRVRSDIERKRLFGLEETARSGSGVGAGIYTSDSSRRVYARLVDAARTILAAGHSVIVDAAFLKAEQREQAFHAAAECGRAAVLVSVEAPHEILRERIRRRAAAGQDASEADLAVLDYQIRTAEPPTDVHAGRTVSCDTSVEIDIDALVATIRRLADSEHAT